MSDKKENVLTRFLGVFRQKRIPTDDIVTMADKIIEEYIFEKNKLIHRRCRSTEKDSSVLSVIIVLSALSAVFVLFKIII